MSTSAAAVSISAVALSMAEQTRQESACRESIRGFEHDTATVAEARQYADCIDLLHPDPMTAEGVFAVKVFMVCAMIGGVLNMIVQRHQVYGYVDWVMFFFLGCVGGLVPPAFYYLLKFLFGG